MLSNIVFGFILPWIAGGLLFKKNPKLVLTIAPFAAVIALSTNEFGLFLDFWDIMPQETESLNCLPLDLGVFPVLGSLFIHFVQRKKLSTWLFLFLFSSFTTVLELTYVLIGKIVYHNGWNITWTFFSYVLTYTLGFLYYILLKKHFVLP
ncbi:hypothetical protein P9G84_32005 [Brevibacillus centrosporus]|uniref:CBO0543 family protein n=1 Tax=Brevibacillus centrosporus TaxID=54910 RepID=UPI001142B483|nr:CBO0543 family protein [Brevibacillus centrosporus]MEC2133475.1 hypothetical protein [Brevibacillus centrosporus]